MKIAAETTKRVSSISMALGSNTRELIFKLLNIELRNYIKNIRALKFVFVKLGVNHFKDYHFYGQGIVSIIRAGIRDHSAVSY